MTKQTLGKMFYEARIAQDISQAKVADAMGYTSPQFISNVERGLCLMPASRVKDWAKVCKVDWKPFLRMIFEVRYHLALRRLE